jgi:crotonobetainyl-CoA:carnitine CoA-transferase CaiB-like acyl-CoA transferase
LADGALADLKVVEYADSISGSYCGKLMADLGADVIKIEAPTSGDTARKTGPFPNDIPDAEKSGLFLYLNTNKRSVTLDLTTKAGADIFRELVKTADVLIENTHPSNIGDPFWPVRSLFTVEGKRSYLYPHVGSRIPHPYGWC